MAAPTRIPNERLRALRAIEQQVLWLAVWMIHAANHLRPKRDGLKVGGHQASSASVTTLMTALYFDVLRPTDRVAVKPHASPVYHAVQYLLGRQDLEPLQRFRAFGGAQSYPSRTKDHDDVDFSTGSVGLGVAMTSFAALARDYVTAHGLADASRANGRMVALVGDAEFDEGNIFEALLEGWKHEVGDVWWVIDYNRQSLDAVVPDRLFQRMDAIFRDMEWDVVTLKYGRLLEHAFAQRGGHALREWIDACPNAQYSALANQGGKAWREQLRADLGRTPGVRELLTAHDDEGLHRLMTNLAGHDMEAVLEAFHAARPGRPTCFLAYTIKGFGLPFAAHKDNHAGLMTPEQVDELRSRLAIPVGQEWNPLAALGPDGDAARRVIDHAPFRTSTTRRHTANRVDVPTWTSPRTSDRVSTQEGFGRILAAIARDHDELARHIVTTSPDVTISTNLGPWVNRRGVFSREDRGDVHAAAHVSSAQKWAVSPKGQHIELGIAESNLFILLGALGLAEPLFGARLLPIGTIYDPFINRGLDALNYACYQDARFMLVATPSGLTLAPEGGAHQSVFTPLVGLGQPSLTSFEPTFVDELSEMMRWGFEHMQAEDGGSVYLRLSTRPLSQPDRPMTAELSRQILEGGYWLVPPAPGAELAIVASGAVVPEALEARELIAPDIPGVGVLVATSADRLHQGWIDRRRGAATDAHIERLLAPLADDAGLVTVLDGHAATLSWLGAVGRRRVLPLGVERFGQSGDIPDLYRAYGLDAAAIVHAAAALCVER